MAMLVQGISVLAREDYMHNNMTGVEARFRLLIPSSKFCKNHQLTRVGLLSLQEVGVLIDELNNASLTLFTHQS